MLRAADSSIGRTPAEHPYAAVAFALSAVPEGQVALERRPLCGQVLLRSANLLQADDVRVLTGDPRHQPLGGGRSDPVDIQREHPHRWLMMQIHRRNVIPNCRVSSA